MTLTLYVLALYVLQGAESLATTIMVQPTAPNQPNQPYFNEVRLDPARDANPEYGHEELMAWWAEYAARVNAQLAAQPPPPPEPQPGDPGYVSWDDACAEAETVYAARWQQEQNERRAWEAWPTAALEPQHDNEELAVEPQPHNK